MKCKICKKDKNEKYKIYSIDLKGYVCDKCGKEWILKNYEI